MTSHDQSISANRLIEQEYLRIWQKFRLSLEHTTWPEATLFSGPNYFDKIVFAKRLLSVLLCQSTPSKDVMRGCQQCSGCYLLEKDTHPDVVFLGMEEKPLNMEITRQLQQDVYQTPLMSTYRFIVIQADRLHVSVINALLKILEEPPAHVRFILLTESASSLPATIKSRCRHVAFIESQLTLEQHMLLQSQERNTSKARLYESREELISQLCDVLSLKMSICEYVTNFTDDALPDVLWFFYWATTEAIYALLGHNTSLIARQLSTKTNMLQLFQSQRRILMLIKQYRQQVMLQPTVAIEALITGLIL